MIRFECDKCGAPMRANDPKRFIVRMELFAAADHLDLDADGDPRRGLSEVLRTLAAADPDEIEDQTYRMLRFDLCDTCRRVLLANPIG